MVDRVSNEIRSKFDKGYVSPRPQDVQPVKHVGCFGVTATMGSETAYPVTVLRAYRDDILMRRKTGRRFIDWYDGNVPRIAAIVAHSKVLRAIAFVAVVAPATLFARLSLALRRGRSR